MTTPPVESMVFKTSTDAAAVPRALGDWAAGYPLNVKNFGAFGDNSHNDYAAIQACFDAAFGPAVAPHGINSYLNRSVYIPGGTYQVGSTLNLTSVKNGIIFGDGSGSTVIQYVGTEGADNAHLVPTLRTNGFENSRIQGINFSGYGPTRFLVALDIDWDGVTTSGVGLRNNVFQETGGGSAYIGIRIGESGHEGFGNYILHTAPGACTYGMKIKSSGHNTFINCFPGANDAGNVGTGIGTNVNPSGNYGYGIWFVTGSATMINAGCAGNQTDILWNSPGTLIVLGGRTEALNFLEITNGRAVIIGHVFNLDTSAPTPPATPDWYQFGYLRNIRMTSPAVVIYDASESSPEGVIQGTGTLYLTGGSRFADARYLTNFTGKIREFINTTPFTMATLPPAAEGLEVNVSNAPVTAWGATPSGTGSVHAKLRWNGTAWTMVGK